MQSYFFYIFNKMRHIFVVNPSAGRYNAVHEIREKLDLLKNEIDHELYITCGPGDATEYVRRWCAEHPEDPVRFYACGGDGTINEVVSGLIGYPNAEVSCYPCGSGNDYIKYYGCKEDYLDIRRIVNGVPHTVDVMKVNNRYSINVCNFGFEAEVCRTMANVRRKPVIGGKRAYTTGIVRSLFTGRNNYCHVKVDGKELHDGKMLLCTLSNGRYVGGNYNCAPLSLNDDGLVEVCLFKPMALLKLVSLIKVYQKGQHLNNPKVAHLMKYCQGKVIEMESPTPFYVVIDGEIMFDTCFKVENLHKAITFVAPCPIDK